MRRSLSRGISTTLSIAIIIALTVILVGGILGYQYYKKTQSIVELRGLLSTVVGGDCAHVLDGVCLDIDSATIDIYYYAHTFVRAKGKLTRNLFGEKTLKVISIEIDKGNPYMKDPKYCKINEECEVLFITANRHTEMLRCTNIYNTQFLDEDIKEADYVVSSFSADIYDCHCIDNRCEFETESLTD